MSRAGAITVALLVFMFVAFIGDWAWQCQVMGVSLIVLVWCLRREFHAPGMR